MKNESMKYEKLDTRQRAIGQRKNEENFKFWILNFELPKIKKLTNE